MADEEQHAEHESQEQADKVVKYYSYCPRGKDCRKGNGTLGGFWSEEAARDAISTHLRHSTYHNFSEDQANHLADSAEIVEHEWKADEEEEEPDGVASRARSKVKARPKEPDRAPRSRERARSQRDRSRSRRRRRPSGSGGGQASGSGGGQAPGSGGGPSRAVAVVNQQLQDGIAVQTRNAMSFVRAMTRAEKALRLAETVSRRAMETFQDMVASKGGCTCCGMTACGSTAKGFLDFL